jgi:hypothetical protein
VARRVNKEYPGVVTEQGMTEQVVSEQVAFEQAVFEQVVSGQVEERKQVGNFRHSLRRKIQRKVGKEDWVWEVEPLRKQEVPKTKLEALKRLVEVQQSMES